MSIQNHRLRLPDVGHLHSHISPVKTTVLVIKHSKLNETPTKSLKPQYIAKRLSTEDLFGEPFRLTNVAGLTQIQEENNAEQDEGLQPRASIDLSEAKKEIINIFKSDMVNPTKYQESRKGPVFKEGRIVKHSIVGTPDMYERYQRLIRRNSKEATCLNSVTDMNTTKHQTFDMNTTKNQTFQRHPSFNYGADVTPSSHSDLDRVWSQRSSMRKLSTISDKRKPLRKEPQLTKEEAVEEISKLKQRQNSICNQTEKTTSIIEQLQLTKDERCLSKFDDTLSKWQRTIEGISRKVGRDEGSSLMLTVQDHREKRELAEALDAVKTDEEKYGSTIWYKTLRKRSEIKLNNKGSITILAPGTNNRVPTDYDEKPPSLEIIRKPRGTKTPIEARRTSEKHMGRTEKEYIQLKFISRKNILKEIRPSEPEELEDFMIQGKNKLDLEADTLLKQFDGGKRTISVSKHYFEKKRPVSEEEIIEQRHNNTDVMRHGLGVFGK